MTLREFIEAKEKWIDALSEGEFGLTAEWHQGYIHALIEIKEFLDETKAA